MWLPTWLGRSYAKLYAHLRLRPFDFKEACSQLGSDEQRVRVILSRLRRAGYLVLFKKIGRKRTYRLMDPSLAVLALGSGLEGYAKIQGRYVRLLLLFAKKILEKYDEKALSIILYGSVARGCPKEDSDIDLLLIIDQLPPSYSKRIDELVSLELDQTIRDELEFLRREGYSTGFSYVPLTPDEAKSFRLLFLDVLTDNIRLLDRGSFFENLSNDFLRRLTSLGAKKIRTNEDSWYWILKPDVKFGEMIQV